MMRTTRKTKSSARSEGRVMDSARLWSQSSARRSIMGTERTHNPSPAASSLLKLGIGKRRLKKATGRLTRFRRRFHRGNPAPAAVLAVAAKIPGLKSILKTPSEKRAAKVAGSLVAAAVSGNLTAAKAIEERQEIGIQKERTVWRSAWSQVPKKIKDQLKKYAELVPGVDHTNPESAAQSALSRAVDVNELEEAAEEAAREVREARAASARETRASRERVLSTVADVGVAGLQAFAGRGRRRSTRRKRRRSSSRTISF